MMDEDNNQSQFKLTFERFCIGKPAHKIWYLSHQLEQQRLRF